MVNVKRFFQKFLRKKDQKPKLVHLKTGVASMLVPTTRNIERIEVFDTKVIDPLGITLQPLSEYYEHKTDTDEGSEN